MGHVPRARSLWKTKNHPTTAHLPKEMVIHDEIYQFKNYSRDKVRVLMRLDEKKLDLKNQESIEPTATLRSRG